MPEEVSPTRPSGIDARTVLCFAYFFLLMASYYIMKPVRESLFLHTQGALSVPIVHLIVGVPTLLVALGYDALIKRWRGGRLVVWCQPILALCILLFWLFMKVLPESGAAIMPWVYYVGVAVYSTFAVALFWSLTHTVFGPGESRRQYGLIAAGGITGGIAGGAITGGLATRVGTENLLVIAAFLVFLCYFLARSLDARRIAVPQGEPELRGDSSVSSWRKLRSDPYVAGIAALVFLTMVVAELGDNQSQRVLANAHFSRDQLTAFYGVLYSRINLLGLAISLFFSDPLQSRFGPGPGLLLLPLAAITEAVFMAGGPSPDALSLILILDLGIQYSVFQSSKELLYTPTDAATKFGAKTVIDTFGYRIGISAGAALVLLCLADAPLWVFSLLAILLSLLVAALAAWLARRYRALASAQNGEALT